MSDGQRRFTKPDSALIDQRGPPLGEVAFIQQELFTNYLRPLCKICIVYIVDGKEPVGPNIGAADRSLSTSVNCSIRAGQVSGIFW